MSFLTLPSMKMFPSFSLQILIASARFRANFKWCLRIIPIGIDCLNLCGPYLGLDAFKQITGLNMQEVLHKYHQAWRASTI